MLDTWDNSMSREGVNSYSDSDERVKQFSTILRQRDLYCVYQPIVALGEAAVFGYEALSRGPEGSVFQRPVDLFDYAEKKGYIYALDQLAREKAIQGCPALTGQQRVFINIPADIIHDPHFTPGQTHRMLQEQGLRPRHVVFEITERSSIEDFTTVKKILAHYRNQGYQIAIDDAGAGYSSLQAIAELQPDYVKVDRSLIRDIHKDKMKEHIMETFLAFSHKMNIRLIAEGIETKEELAKLYHMGVHFGQGYLLGKPALNKETLDGYAFEASRIIRSLPAPLGQTHPIGSLTSPLQTFERSTQVSEVAIYFKEHERAMGAVVVDDGKPVGLVMREKLFQQLAAQYGVPLYWQRAIERLMDADPLIVDAGMPVEKVSQLAMAREYNKLYDFVIITQDGSLTGIATIRSILECITDIRMETARVANPLTGLPGNIQIEREMTRYISQGIPFSVIYADLDYFKWFNDRFGFKKGDHVIEYTADVLRQAAGTCGFYGDFIGHIGGDDFIVITRQEDPSELCQAIIRLFDLGIGVHYGGESIGHVTDRSGNLIEHTGVSISLAAMRCPNPDGLTPELISGKAALLKKQAKKQTGSVYYHDIL